MPKKKEWDLLRVQIRAMVDAELRDRARWRSDISQARIDEFKRTYRLTWVKRHQRKVPIRKGKKK